jgi:2-keto-4-pentenoate hydratase
MDPRVLAGTQAQLESWRAELSAGARRVGWKIAFNAPEVQQKAGLSSPVVGYMTSNTLVGYGARISLAGMANPLIEPEIAIEVGAGGMTAGLGAAIELVDMDTPVDDIEGVIARNVFHRAVLFAGSRAGAPPPEEAIVLVNGEERERAPVEFDEWSTLSLVTDTLAAGGESLEPGDQVIAGSLTAPVEVRPGDAVGVQLGMLGSIQAVFTE